VTAETTPQVLPLRAKSGMGSRTINAAAGVLLAAMQQGRQTPTGLALALDSARLINSPEHAAHVAELETRLAEYERPADEDPIRYTLTEQAPVTIYRAEHPDSGITLGHYGSRAAARKHCETVLRRDVGDEVFLGWVPDDGSEDAPEELCIGEDVVCSGYIVTPLDVPSQYDDEADE